MVVKLGKAAKYDSKSPRVDIVRRKLLAKDALKI